MVPKARPCIQCGQSFKPTWHTHWICSKVCWKARHNTLARRTRRPNGRKLRDDETGPFDRAPFAENWLGRWMRGIA